MKNKNMKLAFIVGLVSILISIYISLSGYETFATAWALFPPVLAIFMALLTKEVYSSLFVGILVGGILGSGGSLSQSLDNVVEKGLIASVSQTAGIAVTDEIIAGLTSWIVSLMSLRWMIRGSHWCCRMICLISIPRAGLRYPIRLNSRASSEL